MSVYFDVVRFGGSSPYFICICGT